MLSRNLSFFSSAGGKRKPEHVRTRVTHSVRAAAKQLQQLLSIEWVHLFWGGVKDEKTLIPLFLYF